MLIYDGDCGFCTTSARWIQRRLDSDVEVVPWQSLEDLGALGLTVKDVTAKAWWVTPDGRLRGGHLAVGEALRAGGGGWALMGRAALHPPTSWIARHVYALVARYRYRLPGATDACRIPADRP